MKIASWNCNSIRARKDRLLTYLGASKPDVLCLQELKCQEEEFPLEEVQALGYHAAIHGQRTYNGVAILSREPAVEVERGLQDGVEDSHCRLIAATVQGIRILCLYAPNGQSVGSSAYAYKLEWYARLRRYLDARFKPDSPLLLCGDFNVAPEPLDVHDPKVWQGQTLFSEPERAALAQLKAFGLHDTFRQHHPQDARFSWWDYRMLAFPKNRGLRIDYLLVTAPLVPRCTASDIDREMRKGKQPSDHAPVWAELS